MIRHLRTWLLTVVSVSQVAFGQPTNNDSISLELTTDGFDFLSDQVSASLPGLLRNVPIGNLRFDIAPIETFLIEGIRVSANADAFKISPKPSGLVVDFNMKDLNISVGHIRSQNYFVPSLGTSCYGTNITLGGTRSIPVHAELGIRLTNNRLNFSINNLRYQVGSDQYRTSGPNSCRTFGIENVLSKVIVEKVLEHSREFILSTISKQTDKLLPTLNSRANELLAMKIPYTLPESAFLHETSLLFGLKPTFLNINSKGFKILARLDVSRLPDGTKANNFLMTEQESKLLATLGISPELVTRILANVLQKGTKRLELTPDLHELLAEVLKRDALGEFWPDIRNVESDRDDAKVFVSLPSSPVITRSEEGALLVSIPKLAVDVEVSQDGEYKPYFNAVLGLEISTLPVMVDGFVTTSQTRATVAVDGDFATGYVPVDSTFNATAMGDFVQAILEFTVDGIVKFELPTFPLGNRVLSLDQLQINDPFVTINVNSVQ